MSAFFVVSPHLDEQPLSSIYSNLQKPKTTTPSPKLRPIPYQGDVPKKTKWFEPPSVIRIQTLLHREKFDGDTIISQDYLNSPDGLDKLDSQRVQVDYETHLKK